MPHPTIAEFKNLYGDVIHRLPVDIGDEFSSESLAKEFRLFPSYMLNDPKVHEVHMYGRSFFIEFVVDMNSVPMNVAKYIMTKLEAV